MGELAKCIKGNLAEIRRRMDDAARRSGRPKDSVKLLAVTKYVGLEETRALIDAGCRDLAESRPQELWRKREQLGDSSIHWHVIGHLQRNKIRRTLTDVAMVHSGDSLRLLEAVSQFSVDDVEDLKIPVLLEVNISGDEAKHGFAPDALADLLPDLAQLSGIEIRGLMGMASRQGGADQARKDFQRLRRLRDDLLALAPSNIRLNELSMGMSGDFEVAIEEGATMVRIGSALFEGV